MQVCSCNWTTGQPLIPVLAVIIVTYQLEYRLQSEEVQQYHVCDVVMSARAFTGKNHARRSLVGTNPKPPVQSKSTVPAYTVLNGWKSAFEGQ